MTQRYTLEQLLLMKGLLKDARAKNAKALAELRKVMDRSERCPKLSDIEMLLPMCEGLVEDLIERECERVGS